MRNHKTILGTAKTIFCELYIFLCIFSFDRDFIYWETEQLKQVDFAKELYSVK